MTELDKKVMYWESKGKEVPTRDLILNEEQIEGIRRAGVVNTGVLDEVAKQIHVGMNTQYGALSCIGTSGKRQMGRSTLQYLSQTQYG